MSETTPTVSFESLQWFLSHTLDEGHNHFRMIAKKTSNGEVSFYIHRVGNEDGDQGDLRTWEFKVAGNALEVWSIDFKDPTKYTTEGFNYISPPYHSAD